MKKRIFSRVLAFTVVLSLCFSLLSVTALADEESPAPDILPMADATGEEPPASEPAPVYVAEATVTVTDENGETTEETKQFTSIADAIEAIGGNGEVTLLAGEGATAENPTEITENVVIEEDAKITLNIPEGVRLQNTRGATTGSNDNPTDQSTILNKGTLTITGGGVIVNLCSYDAGVTLRNAWGATANINGCTFINDNGKTDDDKRAYYVLQNFGTMDIYEGTKVIKDKQTQYSVVVNGWSEGETTKYPTLTPENSTSGVAILNIHSAEIEGSGISIRNTTWGVLTINDGVFTSAFGIQNENEATINGGTFNGSASNYGTIINDCETPSENATGKLVITGGVFNNSSAKGNSLADLSGGRDVNVSGGYYKEQINDNCLLTDTVTPVVCIKVESEDDKMYQAGFLTLEDDDTNRYLYTNLGDGTTTALPTLMLTNMNNKQTVSNTSEVEQITWTTSDDSIATVDENGRISARSNGVVTVVATYTVNGKSVTKEYTVTVDTVYAPVISDDFTNYIAFDPTGMGANATTIEDEETPLAGLFTRADAIGYLWEQTGSPEADLSDFADVPEDHYWAVAIGWAQDMGIALPDEDGNFRPDDLVLRTSDEPEGELQEFLNRYAVFAGVELEDGELFIELDGEAEDFIMGEEAQVIFDEFFAKLESALAAQVA